MTSKAKTAASVADKLREARGLIACGWTQGHEARLKSGHRTTFSSPSAARFCSVGALWRACGGDNPQFTEVYPFMADAIGDLPHGELCEWNDEPGRTQAEVLDAFDKAIELADPSLSQGGVE